MDHFRFIAKHKYNDDAKLTAFATEARDRAGAQAGARYRFSEDHEVISVNVKDGNAWRVIEGVSVLADSLEPHSDMTPGTPWEGAAEYHGAQKPTQAVRQPVKRPGFYSSDMHVTINSSDPLTNDLLERAETLPADRNPAIVNLLFFALTTVALVTLGMFFEKGSTMGVGSAAMWALTDMGWPLLALLVSGFALRYLAGAHNTLRRMELRSIAEAAQNVHQAGDVTRTTTGANDDLDNQDNAQPANESEHASQ